MIDKKMIEKIYFFHDSFPLYMLYIYISISLRVVFPMLSYSPRLSSNPWYNSQDVDVFVLLSGRDVRE